LQRLRASRAICTVPTSAWVPRCMLCVSALCSEHEAQMLLPDSVEYLKDRVFDSPPSGPFPFWASDAVQASARPALCTFSCKGELSHCKLREIASCAVGQSCASKDVLLHVLLEPSKRLRAQYWACFRAVPFRPCPSTYFLLMQLGSGSQWRSRRHFGLPQPPCTVGHLGG